MHEHDLAWRSGLFHDPLESGFGIERQASAAQSPKQRRRDKRPKTVSRKEAAIAAVMQDLRMLVYQVEAASLDGKKTPVASPTSRLFS